MKVTSITRRLASGELHYALGRFETVRRGYSAIRRISEPSRRFKSNYTPAMPAGTLFPALSLDAVDAAMRQDSVAMGFDLPPEILAELIEFAMTTPFQARGMERTFLREEVRNGSLPDGTRVVLALSPNPMACPAVRRVADDPVLMEAATRYLGYRPKKIIPRVFWSFATDAGDEERRNRGQTIDWHFDVHDFAFCSASFYLTDVDRDSGAHALVRGSHRGKKLKMLLGSANAPDDLVVSHYGADRILVIEGPAGTGFLEDTSCYHRALPPKNRDRLMMMLWMS
ncbi:hypothetical protein [Azospirillum sp. SYSU D00513]|uniref:hypothetical protein n=1 Tax=Azospirillum sp. SYSU D00513 TaxID=2812561 RepID=UPI001A97BC93|nr:hypothetical protein [Azospirillum sp. SYSU D00513]